MPQFQEPSTWTSLRVQQHIDPILLGDKRLSISLEMQPRSLAAKDSAKNPSQWADAEIKIVNEWAEKLYAAWIEIWDIQGFPRCHALYRAIYEWELQQLFATRRSCFQGKCQQLETVKRRPHYYSAALGWFAREMDKLASDWNRRMNVESRKARYAANLQSQTKPPTIERTDMAASNFTWRELEVRFRDLQAKMSPRQNVRAELHRTTWDSGSVNEEWEIHGPAALRSEFVGLALIASRKLGYPPYEDGYKNWLGRLWKWAKQAGLDKERQLAWCPTGSGSGGGSDYTVKYLFTESIAEFSAMFCLELIARDTPESTVSRVSGGSGPVAGTTIKSGLVKKAGRPMKRNREFDALAGRLWLEELNGSKRVTSDGLRRIAAKLDESEYKKPSDHLEKKAADALRIYNRNYGNAPTKKILSWTHLVDRGEKNQVRAMREVLSRCGGNVRK